MVAEAAGRQHPSRRDLPVRHGVGVRVLRRLPHRLRALPAEHRGRADRAATTGSSRPASPTSSSPGPAPSASTTTTSGSPRCWSRWTASASTWDLLDERAEPGYYACTLSSGIRCELTVGPRSAVHRYTFPASRDARIVIDFSMGGLAIPYGSTVPLRSHLEAIGPGVAQAETVVEGAPLATHVECDAGDWRQLLWYDRRLMHGGTRLDFDRIRPTTLRPVRPDVARAHRAGPGGRAAVRLLAARGGAGPGQPAGRLRARGPATHGGLLGPDGDSLIEDPTMPVSAPGAFEDRRQQTAAAWREHLDTIKIETAVDRPEDDLRHRALPLADQALLRHRREPVLAEQRSVRVRHLHDVGHLPDPAAADHRPVPRPGRRAGQRDAEHLRGGGQPADRLPDGQGGRPVLPAGQRAVPTPSWPTCASSGSPAWTGTGRCATWTPTCAARTGRSSCSAA